MRLGAFLSVLALLVGCNIPGPSLAGYEGLQVPVQRYYETYATEKGGTCRRPQMWSITQSEVLEDTDEQLVLRIRYSWRDDAFERQRPGVVFRTCDGFAERVFTIDKTTGLQVVDMTGERREQRDFSG